MSEENQPDPLYTLEFYTEEGQLSRWRKIGPARHVAEIPQDDRSTALMKRWLSECLHIHSACQRDTLSQLPTRLIAVGSSNEDLYLHVPTSGERSEYVALSHHWGQHKPLVTKNASLKAHQKRLKFDGSSKLFAEAVELTRTLGYPYIWIDSLCIIQDSPEDWSREAGRMTTVFNNAALTLFAHASQDSSCSLYPDASSRNKSIVLSVASSAKDDQKSEDPGGTVFVREIYRYPHRVASSYHSGKAPRSSFLASRGWVLQEELLSPRSLHFNAEEMSWTCSSYSRCECRIRPNNPLPSLYRDAPTKAGRQVLGPDTLHADSTVQNQVVSSSIQLQSILSNPTDQEGNTTADLLADWPYIVTEYSHRLLTKPSDKLPALTGLAGYIQKVSPSEKFAGGIWLSDLPFQLLWSRDHVFEGQRTGILTNEAKTERQKLEIQTYTTRHLRSATWAWMSLPTHAAIHYPTRNMTRSPMKRSHDYVQQMRKSQDRFSHFVKPLFGDSDFIKILDINVWPGEIAMESWGPGLLTLACRYIHIGVFDSVTPSDESDKASSEDGSKEMLHDRASATEPSYAIVDQSGGKGGMQPSDLDLDSLGYTWDFPILQGETPIGTFDTKITPEQLAVIDKWRGYKHEEDKPDQATNSIQKATSPSTLPITIQGKESNAAGDSIRTASGRPAEQGKPSSGSTPAQDNKNRMYALVLAGVMTWVYNFTPKRLEGVCLLLEQVDGANNVYRRVGHVTGAGSAEAWEKDIPKRLIHIV